MLAFFDRYINSVWKRLFIPLILFVLVAILETGYLSEHFRLNSDFRALFRGNNQTVKDLEALEKKVGSSSTISIIVSSPDKQKNIDFMREIAPDIKTLKDVRFVEFERDIDYLDKHALLYLSIEDLQKIKKNVKQKISKQVVRTLSLTDDNNRSNDTKKADTSAIHKELERLVSRLQQNKKKHHIRRYYEAENGTLMAMKVRLKAKNTAVSATKKIVKKMKNVVAAHHPDKHGVTVEIGGYFKNKVKEIEQINADLYSTLALCIILLVFVIFFYFRSVSAIFIVLLPLSFGVLSGITFTLFFLKEFTIVSASSFAILYGLGIDFAIHLFSRYTENKRTLKKPSHAMIATYRQTVPAIISGAITTALAFFTLVFIQFKGFSDFGFVAGVGVITSLAAILFFFPVLIFAMEKSMGMRAQAIDINTLSTVYNTLTPRGKAIIVFAAILFIASLWAAYTMPFEYRLNKLSFPKTRQEHSLTTQYEQATKKEKTDVMIRTIPTFVLTRSRAETADLTAALRSLKKNRGNRTIKIKDFLNIYTFIPDNQQQKLKIIAGIKRLIDRKIGLFDEKTATIYHTQLEPYLAVTTPVEEDKIPAWIHDRLSDKQGHIGTLTTIAFDGNKNDIKTAITIRNEYGFIKGNRKRYKARAVYFLLADIKEVLNRDVPLSILLALSMVFLTLIISFRSIRAALVVISPLIVGLLWMVGGARIFGFSFNIFNMIVIPTVVGIGIDSAIHVYHRYRDEGIDAMPVILKRTGGAVLFSSLTTFVGFISLAFARHNGMKSIGEMASIGIVTVTIANIILFPLVIYIFSSRRHFRSTPQDSGIVSKSEKNDRLNKR